MQRSLLGCGLVCAATLASGQVALKPVPALQLEYSIQTNIPAKAAGNQDMETLVTVKNTAAAAQQVMVCVRGDSRFVVAGRELSLGSAVVTVKAAGTQLQCSKETSNTDLDSAIGNMGCRVLQSLAAGASVPLRFVTGSLPRDPNDRTPVQDGISRPSNNQREGKPPGPAGAGHRTRTLTGRYKDDAGAPIKGIRSVREIMQTSTVHFFTMPVAGWEMACLSRDEALNRDDKAFVAQDPPKRDYVLPCATPRNRTLACNQCYGMQTRFVIDKNLPAAVKHSREILNFKDVPLLALQRRDLSIPIELGLARVPPIAGPCNVSLSAQFIPGVGGALAPGFPGEPGTFSLTPSAIDLAAADGAGTLSFTGPASVPSNFAGDFFVTAVHADSCGGLATPGETLLTEWIRVRPQLLCDVNQSGAVDEADIAEIMAAIGTEAEAGNPLDVTGDRLVTVSDARRCALQCAKPNCAP
ncbi:MAG: hypothetical protein SFV54_21860 [Bryobacteraceae bacterium]|nr:hypothetical protein [Bryobacteraceae bacterium]